MNERYEAALLLMRYKTEQRIKENKKYLELSLKDVNEVLTVAGLEPLTPPDEKEVEVI